MATDGLKFKGADGVIRSVSSTNPLPTQGGGGTGAASQQVQGNTASGTTDVGNPVKVGGVTRTTIPVLADGQRGDLYLSTSGDLVASSGVQTVTGADSQANATPGPIGVGSNGARSLMTLTTRSYNYNGITWDRQRGDTTGSYTVSKPAVAGGHQLRKVVTAATTNGSSIKASAGQVFGMSFFNAAAAVRTVKLYNLAVAPTVGTSVPVWSETIAPGGRLEINRPLGVEFTVGIAIAVTTGYADTDTGATAVGDVVGSIAYN